MRNAKIYAAIIFSLLLVAACESNPKVIESEPISSSSDQPSPFHSAPPVSAEQPDASGVHKVVVKETLDTDRYTYLNVTEGEANYWLAIPKQAIEVGATYYYQGGLLKRNFKSQEYNRTFETLYLVSGVEKEGKTTGGSAIDEALAHTQRSGSIFKDAPVTASLAEGAVKLSELIANPKKYEGKLIRVAGKCIKINPMIMGRNWVHIQDGSGEGAELTVTTTENVPLGAEVAFEGTIALDKDFGAGYRYAIIMEGAVRK